MREEEETNKNNKSKLLIKGESPTSDADGGRMRIQNEEAIKVEVVVSC